jgi:formylglycine-generating enzyme required for sulfatase activity
VVIAKPAAGMYWMGEGKECHRQPLGHDFAVSSEHVTVEQFMQFSKETGREYKFTEEHTPTKDCPAIDMSWYEAAEYCNWLSKREGIGEAQWCYEPNKDGKYVEGMKIKAGYLGLKGYRLPTEVEWEYACRAGSMVGYGFGEPVELLEKYGWFVVNSLDKAHPCGMLKPNDLGLFDMHGNVLQWTQSVENYYSNKAVDKEDDSGELVAGASSRVSRGGCWFLVARNFRAASRFENPPDYRIGSIGFRLARVPVVAGGK